MATKMCLIRRHLIRSFMFNSIRKDTYHWITKSQRITFIMWNTMTKKKSQFNEANMKKQPKDTFQEPDLENNMVPMNDKEKANSMKIPEKEVQVLIICSIISFGLSWGMALNFIIDVYFYSAKVQYAFGNSVQLALIAAFSILINLITITSWLRLIKKIGKIKLPKLLKVLSNIDASVVNWTCGIFATLLYIILSAFVQIKGRINIFQFILASVLYHLGVSEQFIDSKLFPDVPEYVTKYI
ncbi:hypothetical protein Kpol_489p2 [Vanderwaltozyma polyspora DSM 70294]|uniref:Uncharacterized protein n=1 Tax=Vanderwaltozyma polyspora (strain ATCC 22028 / DSM 70294 / BCRC 21397 / CBS 2163 / NBRC 10782 / NRRL Y-8283 / UCD 57-17) TaxID=436907 RepID=A7TQ16_VANPO|nr:uncharacterized protein Kpol_489p2 [Vanderwaltozyma polyspora DSM 70294]EDO15621.1 hypothetical protein Kpol_489p2 [Vanderwaltozyma polyspora DSM 70294]